MELVEHETLEGIGVESPVVGPLPVVRHYTQREHEALSQHEHTINTLSRDSQMKDETKNYSFGQMS